MKVKKKGGKVENQASGLPSPKFQSWVNHTLLKTDLKEWFSKPSLR